MLIFIIVVAGLSLLVLGHEAGHFFAAKAFGLKVDEFGFGFPPRIFAIRPKNSETEYSFNWLPFGGFVRIGGERSGMAESEAPAAPSAPADESRLFYSQPAWKKSIIMLAGVFVNFLLGWFLISIALMTGTPQTVVVTQVASGSPAQAAGFQAGDVLKGYTSAQSFIDYVNAHRGATTTVAVLRSDREIDIAVTPRVSPPPGQGAIGIALDGGGAPPEAPLPAVRDGFMSSVLLMGVIVSSFWQLIVQLFGHASLMPGVVGPVGIVSTAEEVGRIGFTYLVQFLGIISINLTVVNLIPFPALDGGRFVMALLEKIKGSAVPERFETWINGIGFAFLIVLMILLTIRDIGGLI